jgi:hypothetical protein
MGDYAQARFAVHDVMHRYALAIDTKNWAALEAVFAPTLTADFRSFGAKEIFRGDGRSWVAQVRSTIEGMDATQHLMSNHLYQLGETRASGTTYIQAVHICKQALGEAEYTIGGHYDVQMVCLNSTWCIQEYALQCRWHRGNRSVLKAAVTTAKNARPLNAN